ncbi:MAG TPA: M14 family zinc carboxypeptidase [bacterium]|nr:M14 family zinc carboxypeptidase [bacterium]
MVNSSTVVAAFLLFCIQGTFAQTPKHLAVIPLPSHSAVYDLPRWLDITDVTENSATIVATDQELAQLRALGYSPRITVDDYQARLEASLLGYHTYEQVCSTMTALASAYPLICRLETLGFSVQNRAILMMRVTHSPQTEKAEPEFRILGPHHGDEKIGTEITLSFLQYVLSSYDTSPPIHNLLVSTELWVVPIVNVDGFVLNQRENANGIDLNRDYGYRWSGMGNSPSPFSQPETRLIRQHDLDNNISMEFAYHSAASYVNYLWDNHPADPPDSGLIQALAQQYADSTYGSGTTRLTPINGYSWYEVDGSCQDASFGLFGNLAYTIETKQPTAQAQIDSICVANRRALLGMIQAADHGISGLVRDSATGTPLFARISVDSPLRWDCYANTGLGYYHKPLPPGEYTLTAHAQGYLPQTVTGVVVTTGVAANANFNLVPDTSGNVYVEEMVWINNAEPGVTKVMPTTSIFALGAPDGRYFSLGREGDVCLSAGRGRTIRNVQGWDVRVYDGDTVADGYWLYAGNDWTGPWTSLGHANGTHTFDIGVAGLDSARYLRIVCDSTASVSDPKAGLDLDAVSYRTSPAGINSPIAPRPSSLACVYPSPARQVLYVTLPPACRRLEIIDITGRLVKCYPFGTEQTALDYGSKAAAYPSRFRVDLKNIGLRPGIYMARLETATGTWQRKFVVARP